MLNNMPRQSREKSGTGIYQMIIRTVPLIVLKKLLNEEAPKLKEGKMLYDQIMEGKTALYWSHKEEECFNKYYAATHYQSYNRLRKVKRATKLSAHNLFYLILKDMGKSDDEVRRIMALSPEGLRSIRSRTKPLSLGN